MTIAYFYQTHIEDEYKAPELSEVAIKILDVAMNLFARKGYTATSVREIVQQAEVTTPMLYYYFKNKEGVFTALIDILFGTMEKQVGHVLNDHTLSFKEKLKQIAYYHFEGCCENPQALKFVYSVIFGPSESRPEVDIFELRQTTFNALEDLFKQAIENRIFKPANGYEPFFLTQQFVGLINDRLMFAFKMSEHTEMIMKTEQKDFLRNLLNEKYCEDLVHFFFYGATRQSS